MRELWWMAEARMFAEWDQTSLIWSAIANTCRDAKKHPKPFSPAMVHPLRTESDYKEKPIEIELAKLKSLFSKGE